MAVNKTMVATVCHQAIFYRAYLSWRVATEMRTVGTCTEGQDA